ncbi:MAG TPA: hypothetical protein VF329_11265 [Gammaproteobacteria bacterium]
MGREVDGSARISVLKTVQLAVAVGVLVLFWLIYPGTLLLITGAVGLCYLIASIAAIWDKAVAVWIAFVLTVLTFAFSTWGVYRYLDNGFDYLAGHFEGRDGIYWPAYLFLLVALGSIVVIVLHVSSWRWMGRPRERGAG